MHGRGDIIRSQMFYSVYTKVTRANHQRTSSPCNLAPLELVLKLKKKQKKKREVCYTSMKGCMIDIYIYSVQREEALLILGGF